MKRFQFMELKLWVLHTTTNPHKHKWTQLVCYMLTVVTGPHTGWHWSQQCRMFVWPAIGWIGTNVTSSITSQVGITKHWLVAGMHNTEPCQHWSTGHHNSWAVRSNINTSWQGKWWDIEVDMGQWVALYTKQKLSFNSYVKRISDHYTF